MTTDAHVKFDQAKAETFADQLLTTLNNGALCLMLSVGRRTGLFDVMRTLPPSTSADIAATLESAIKVHSSDLPERPLP